MILGKFCALALFKGSAEYDPLVHLYFKPIKEDGDTHVQCSTATKAPTDKAKQIIDHDLFQKLVSFPTSWFKKIIRGGANRLYEILKRSPSIIVVLDLLPRRL